MVASERYTQRIIAGFEQAAEANWQTPGRQGNVVVLSDDMADEVMITGDVHGNQRNFNLIRKIAAMNRFGRRHLVLQEVCHGGPTYPQNGGCMSHSMLEDVAELKVKYPDRVHFILGNHELAELTDYPIQKNKQMLNLLFRLGMQQMYGPATDRVREAMFSFVRSCPLAVRMPAGIFISHSIPEFVDTREFDASIFDRKIEQAEYAARSGVFQLVWGRDYREVNARAFAELVGARVLVNGHEPCPEGFSVPNDVQIILDCCADKASHLLLSTGREWSHAEIVEQIRPLR
ncbi:MAG: metallophosphoesterase [Candidatus Nealsonbacteria bacterium]|nr:metallophosphoesterase [Candidatus Nealsonbacteria bacterium]